MMLVVSCIDPYYPRINDYVDLPVIEGMITDGPGPYTIRITHSTAIQNMAIKPITGAQVTISDDMGVSEVLSETEPGIYMTSPSGIRGQIGRSYQVTVETGGKKFQSQPELIAEPAGIDTIFTRPEKHSVTDGYVDGLQFYVNTEPISDTHTNLLWSITETYRFRSEYKLDWIYYGVDSIVKNHSDSGMVCWRTDRETGIFTWSASNLTEPSLKNFPLQFIDVLTNKLSERYSMLLTQYTISEPAYNYWSEIQKLYEETGSLYTRQPYQVKGNISNTEEPETLVLGYFIAASTKTKRVYIDRPPFVFNYEVCSPVINLYQNTNPLQLSFPLYSMELSTGEQAFASLSCFDCRLKGGTMEKPDFWKE
jgi:hypothetical protein